MTPFRACSAVFVFAAVAVAQETQERTLQLTVTGGSDRSVYLDLGRDAGLQIGQVVQVFPPGAASIDVEIRSLSSTSARAELPPGVPLPPVGSRGEARVRVASGAGGGQNPASPQVPAHPPWARQEAARTPDQPLLVPTFRQRPEDRPMTLDGRAFLLEQWSRDNAGDRSSDYLLSRLGVRADATNVFGAAERIRFAGEVDDRRVSVADAADEVDDNARLDLLSVAFGTEAWSPNGLEAGRFLSSYLPEIGLVDGLEYVRRYEGGLRVGGGIGAYPRPFPSQDTGDDVGVHGFVDWSRDARRSFAAAFGLQKTWHQGAPDRDLLLFRLEGRPTDRVSLYGNAKVDIYTGSDTVKGSGAELSEAFGSARWDGRDLGTGLTLSHFTWPELKRAEYQNLPEELVRDGHVERVSWNGWWRPIDRLRLGLRGDFWQDQDHDGTSVTADGDLRDPIGAGTDLLLSVYRTDGGYSSGPGAYASLRGPVAGGSWRVGYRWHRYDVTGLVSGDETFTRQSAEVGLSLPVFARGDLDLSLEHWFGDQEDSWTLGLFLQWRF